MKGIVIVPGLRLTQRRTQADALNHCRRMGFKSAGLHFSLTFVLLNSSDAIEPDV